MSFATFRAGLLVAGLATLMGCGETNPYGDGGIPPLDDPDGADTALPDTPLNRFDRCFPPNQSLQLHIDGRGAAWGNPQQTQDGGVVLQIDRASLSLLGGGGVDDGSNRFTGIAQWGSAPAELQTQNPGDPGYALMAGRAVARANGEPMTSLRRTGMTGSWAEQFPGFTAGGTVGFIWYVEGDFDSDCSRRRFRLHGGVRGASQGFTGPQDFIPLPLYSGGTRLASPTFANEGVAVLDDQDGEGLAMEFSSPAGDVPPEGYTSERVEACNGDCGPIAGSGLQSAEGRLIILPPGDE